MKEFTGAHRFLKIDHIRGNVADAEVEELVNCYCTDSSLIGAIQEDLDTNTEESKEYRILKRDTFLELQEAGDFTGNEEYKTLSKIVSALNATVRIPCKYIAIDTNLFYTTIDSSYYDDQLVTI